MKRKDFGLFVSLVVLIFMAVFSEKKILIAEGYAVTRNQLDQGEKIYDLFCRECHGNGRGGAPRLGDDETWHTRAQGGMSRLISHAVNGYRGGKGFMPPKGGAASLTAEEVALATAYMVAENGHE